MNKSITVGQYIIFVLILCIILDIIAYFCGGISFVIIVTITYVISAVILAVICKKSQK